MPNESIILKKSYDFALKIVKLYQKLQKDHKEFFLSGQLAKNGTAIGVMVEEGDNDQTKKEFIADFSMALKEAKETHYWLRLLRDSNLIDTDEANELIDDCTELIRIISSFLTTARKEYLA